MLHGVSLASTGVRKAYYRSMRCALRTEHLLRIMWTTSVRPLLALVRILPQNETPSIGVSAPSAPLIGGRGQTPAASQKVGSRSAVCAIPLHAPPSVAGFKLVKCGPPMNAVILVPPSHSCSAPPPPHAEQARKPAVVRVYTHTGRALRLRSAVWNRARRYF